MPTTLNKPTHILILTPIPVEYNEVRRHFDTFTEEIINDVCYGFGRFKGKYQDLSIVLCQTGSKNRVIALATERAIQLFNPSVVLLVGIAGGVKDVVIGDIVIGTKAYGYESGKETEDGPVSRPDVINYSQKLLAIAKNIHQKEAWKARSPKQAMSSKVFFGPIASGNKVIATTKTAVYAFLKKHYNDTLALEMESIGFGQTMLHYSHIQGLNIRGISDLLENKSKTDTAGSQALAASRAAAFAFELIYNLDISQFKVSTMDIKTMAGMVFSALLPFIKKSTSIQQMSSDISAATDETVSSIWEIIKPIFIEEFEEEDGVLAESAKEEAIVTHVLKKTLKKETAMKEDLEALMTVLESKKVRKKQIIKDTTIEADGNVRIGDESAGDEKHWDEKNIVENSTIKTKGDFHLGDGENK